MSGHDRNMDGLNVPSIATAGFVAAIGTFVAIVALQVLYLRYFESDREERQANQSSSSLLAEQKSKLNRYGWIDRESGSVAIPIGRAMELTVAEWDRDGGEQTDDSTSASPAQPVGLDGSTEDAASAEAKPPESNGGDREIEGPRS